jgi:hypothetical protein
LRINSNQHQRPGYLIADEAYNYLNWIHNFYGSPSKFPLPDEVRRKFTSKPAISYKEFVDFIEPYYRGY